MADPGDRLLRGAVWTQEGGVVRVDFPDQRRRLARHLDRSVAAYRWAVWQEELVAISRSEYERFRKLIAERAREMGRRRHARDITEEDIERARDAAREHDGEHNPWKP